MTERKTVFENDDYKLIVKKRQIVIKDKWMSKVEDSYIKPEDFELFEGAIKELRERMKKYEMG